MAEGRFGSTANRPFTPSGPPASPGAGATIPRGIPSGGIPRGMPTGPVPGGPNTFQPSQQQLQNYQQTLLALGGSRFPMRGPNGERPNLQSQRVMAEIASRYNRPDPLINGLFRALRVGENVGVGAAKTVNSWVHNAINAPEGGITGAEVMQLLSPWVYMNAQGDVVSEVGSSIKEDMTYYEWIKESADPDSFLYQHAMPIGLGLSFFGDPTTYLTFGATGASKVAATQLFTRSWMNATEDAATALRTGKHFRSTPVLDDAGKIVDRIETVGGPLPRGATLESLSAEYAYRNGIVSIGDGMAQLRNADRAAFGVRVSKARAEGKLGIKAGISGATRAAFARGGTGIRFAGVEVVPGTALEKVGTAFGKATKGALTMERLSRGGMSAFMPDAKIHQIHEDAMRTVFLSEKERILQDIGTAQDKAVRDGLAEFALRPDKATQAVKRAGAGRAAAVSDTTAAIRNMFFMDTNPVFVPKGQRLDILQPGFKPEGQFADKSSALRENILLVKQHWMRQAEEFGYDTGQLKALDARWDRLVEDYRDPIDVLMHFVPHISGRLATDKAIDQLIQNPMFARFDISEGENALLKAQDNLERAREKVMKQRKLSQPHMLKKLSGSQKGGRKTQLKNAEAAFEEAKIKHVEAEEAFKRQQADAGARGVRKEDWQKTLHQSAVPFRWRNREYLVPSPIADTLEDLRNPALLDREMRDALKRLHWTQNKWKILATSMNPSFHVMNLVGGMWNNLLGGIYNPGNYLAQVVDMYRMRAVQKGQSSAIPGRGLLQRAAPINPQRLEGFQDQIAGMEARLGGAGLVRNEADTLEAQQIRKVGKRGLKTQRLVAGAKVYGATAVVSDLLPGEDEWMPDEIDEALNPLLGLIPLVPGIARAGSKVANDVEEINRYTHARVAMKDRSIKQIIDLDSVMPPTMFGRYMDEDVIGVNIHRELVYDIGAAMANRYQFNYSRLTEFERKFAKLVFPFYTFYKNNFILQTKEFINRPRFIGAFDTARQASEATANYVEGGMGDDENNPYFQQLLPEYFDRLNMFRLPVPDVIREQLGLPQDTPLYLNPKLPFASLNMFPPLWELANDDSVTPTHARVMQLLAPAFGMWGPAGSIPGMKPLLEYTVGYQLGLARPIDYQRLQSGGWRQSTTPAPGYIAELPGFLQDWLGVHKDPQTGQLAMNASLRYLADQLASPFITGIGEPIALGSAAEGDKTKANTIAWMSGIRMTPVDPIKLQRGWLYRMESYLEGQKSEMKRRGLTMGVDDQVFLKQIRAQIRVVERAYDAKQEALYGPQR